jgi:chromosome segregation protein
MKIKRVEINGFKSFMDLTSLGFDDSITAIVGPNGCGKSNVVDAIRWVLGEQAPRRLRGKAMEDVIFNGSEKQGPSGMSEVTITFANDGRNVPPLYASHSEIAVSRRLFRSGESEYMINKQPCRLRDVVELFLGTGVGTRSYSIIEQGMVSDIISFKPEERRLFIEEAAGITLYRERKKMALRKMEQTRQNLQRIDDVVAEVTRQMNAVQRQAKKAERYRKFSEEARELERKAVIQRYHALCGSMAALGSESGRLRETEVALHASVSTMENDIETSRASLIEEERALSAAQEELYRAESALRENEGRIGMAKKDAEAMTARNAEYAVRVEALQRKAQHAHVEEETERERARELEEMLGVHKSLKAEQEEQLRTLREESSGLSQQVDEGRSRIVEVLTEVARHRNHILHLSDREADLRNRMGRTVAEKQSLEKASTETTERRVATAAKLEKSRQLVVDLGRQEEALRQSLQDLKSQSVTAEAKSMALREELTQKRSRLTSLLELQEKYEGFKKGVRSVMARKAQAEKSGREAGVFGLVADIIETTPMYETAVEAVLGERLQYVIVKSHEEGVEAIDWLKNSAEGRSTFIPMSLKQYDSGGAFPRGDGILGSVKGMVSYDPGYEQIVDYLLGDAVMVDNLGHALTIWSANGYRKTLVTVDGEVVDPRGVVTGGKVEGNETGFLTRKREIKELQVATRDLDAECRLLAEKHQKIKSHLAQVEAALENMRNDAHNAKLTTLGVEKELIREDEELARLADRIRVVGFEIDQAERTIAEVSAAIDKSKEEIGRLEVARESLESGIEESSARLNVARERERFHEAELASAKVREAGDEERLRSVGGVLERIARDVKSMQEEITALLASITDNTRILAGLKTETTAREEEARGLVARLSMLRDGLGERRGQYDEKASGIHASEEGLKAARDEYNAARERLGDVTLKLRENELQKAHMEESARERMDMNLSSLSFEDHMPPAPLTEEEILRLDQLKKQMEEMGEINLLAIKEFEELTQRKEFLSTHRDDLERSLDSLQRAIQKINRTSRERFIQTFNLVDAKFKEIFPRLFHGGRAGLKLMDEADILETGVDIFAQPPGKKLQSIDLLSGGEKALTAIALIFSIFLIKPSPFCLMDEVDAPLDDANIGRFLSMVNDLSSTSQFIIITHNKRTMEIARKLYGVTMEEPGVSKVISVRMKHADEVEAA